MSKFIYGIDGNDIDFIRAKNSRPTLDHIPAAVYYPFHISNPMGEAFGLRKLRDKFETPEGKRYGLFRTFLEQIVQSFEKDLGKRSTGVMAIGKAGCGKTLLAEDIANRLLAKGYPVIILQEKVPVRILQMMLNQIQEPCMLFIDEYGKMYKDDEGQEQAELLKLFSDNSLKNKLFFIASNSDDDMGVTGIVHRPQRFRFNIQARFLEESSIYEMLMEAKISERTRDFLLLNFFDSDGELKHRISNDIARFILSEIDENDTPNSIGEKSRIWNIPPLFGHASGLSIQIRQPETAQPIELFDIVKGENDEITAYFRQGDKTEKLSMKFDSLEMFRKNIENRQNTGYEKEKRYNIDCVEKLLDDNTRITMSASLLSLSSANFRGNLYQVQKGSLDVPKPKQESSPTQEELEKQNVGIGRGNTYPSTFPGAIVPQSPFMDTRRGVIRDWESAGNINEPFGKMESRTNDKNRW